MKNNDNIYTKVVVLLPKSIHKELVIKERETGIGVGKLLVIAADNELTESVNPFRYDVKNPEVPEGIFWPEEGSRILKYLESVDAYIQKEILVAARRDMGIENREQFMQVYTELLHNGMIVEFTPSPIYNWKPHPNSKFVKSNVKPKKEPKEVPKKFKSTAAYRKK